jgi:hypothetical protein
VLELHNFMNLLSFGIPSVPDLPQVQGFFEFQAIPENWAHQENGALPQFWDLLGNHKQEICLLFQSNPATYHLATAQLSRELCSSRALGPITKNGILQS